MVLGGAKVRAYFCGNPNTNLAYGIDTPVWFQNRFQVAPTDIYVKRNLFTMSYSHIDVFVNVELPVTKLFLPTTPAQTIEVFVNLSRPN